MPNKDNEDEDKYTIKYMKEFWLNNVRGGSFCKIELSKEEILIIDRMIKGNSNICYICGSSDHFINDCPQNKKKPIKKEFKKYVKKEVKKILNCYRCGREGHMANNCYAKTDIDGNYISDDSSESEYEEVYCCRYCNKEFDTEKGCNYHENVHCKAKKKNNYKKKYY